MSPREATAGDRDWWMAHVSIALFGVFVAALLGSVPGWSVPLHAWIVLAAFVIALLAAHAGARAAACAMQRRWRRVATALLLAAALVASAAMLMRYGRSHMTTLEDAMLPPLPVAGDGAR